MTGYPTKEVKNMFEICAQLLIQLIQCLPVLFGVYLIFEFVGALLFGKDK